MFHLYVSKTKNDRFWEIDFLRGVAIIMMIIYHVFFDLYFLDVVKLDLYSLPFRLFLYPIGTTFLLLVGMSLSISYSREKNNLSEREIWLKFLRRGLMIFCLGLVITVFTWFFLVYWRQWLARCQYVVNGRFVNSFCLVKRRFIL